MKKRGRPAKDWKYLCSKLEAKVAKLEAEAKQLDGLYLKNSSSGSIFVWGNDPRTTGVKIEIPAGCCISAAQLGIDVIE